MHILHRALALDRMQKQADTMRRRAERKMGLLEVGCVVQASHNTAYLLQHIQHTPTATDMFICR